MKMQMVPISIPRYIPWMIKRYTQTHTHRQISTDFGSRGKTCSKIHASQCQSILHEKRKKQNYAVKNKKAKQDFQNAANCDAMDMKSDSLALLTPFLRWNMNTGQDRKVFNDKQKCAKRTEKKRKIINCRSSNCMSIRQNANQ